jgi:hypothetical protein
MKKMFGLLFVLGLFAVPHPAAAGEVDYLPDEVRATPYCGVHHFNQGKTRGGRPLNETPNCYGGSVGWDLNTDGDIEAGVSFNAFRNSIYKHTVLAGAYIETDLYKNKEKDGLIDACGVGALAAVQLVKGYDTPILGDVYGYCEKWRFRANAAVIPPVGNVVDAAVIWSVDFKLWEG